MSVLNCSGTGEEVTVGSGQASTRERRGRGPKASYKGIKAVFQGSSSRVSFQTQLYLAEAVHAHGEASYIQIRE